jgi:hypothetical protein
VAVAVSARVVWLLACRAVPTGLPSPPSRSDAPTGSCAADLACHGAADASDEEDFCYAAEYVPCCAMSLRGTDADCTIS